MNINRVYMPLGVSMYRDKIKPWYTIRNRAMPNDRNEFDTECRQILTTVGQVVLMNREALSHIQVSSWSKSIHALHEALLAMKDITNRATSPFLWSSCPSAFQSNLVLHPVLVAQSLPTYTFTNEGDVSFFGYAFDISLQVLENDAVLAPTPCHDFNNCSTLESAFTGRDTVTVGGLLDECTEAIMYNLAIIYHCASCLLQGSGVAENLLMNGLAHKAVALYGLVEQWATSTSLACMKKQQLVLLLAVLNNLAHLHSTYDGSDDTRNKYLLHFEEAYCHAITGYSNIDELVQENPLWKIFRSTMMHILRSHGNSAAAA
jgi:hypothetical protein